MMPRHKVLNAQFIRTEKLCKRLNELKPKTKEVSKELNCDSEELDNLLGSYVESLKETYDWLKDKAWDYQYKDTNKISHYASLFFNLKENLPDDITGYFYRGGQSSVHLGIGKREVEICGVKGNLIIWLKDKNLQIFLEQYSGDKTNSSKASEIRKELKAKWQDLGKGNTLPRPKAFPEYLCVLSIPYPKFQPNEFEEILDFIGLWNERFINICNEYEK